MVARALTAKRIDLKRFLHFATKKSSTQDVFCFEMTCNDYEYDLERRCKTECNAVVAIRVLQKYPVGTDHSVEASPSAAGLCAGRSNMMLSKRTPSRRNPYFRSSKRGSLHTAVRTYDEIYHNYGLDWHRPSILGIGFWLLQIALI